METSRSHQETTGSAFRALHAPGRLLILPNAWDAGSARLIVACGAEAVATTSAGLAWSRGYPDGDALPLRVLETAVQDMARTIDVPLTVDVEGGYSSEPRLVGELVAAIVQAGAAGINIEDGGNPPELLCAKIAAARSAAQAAGRDLFINARTDVYLRGLAPAGQAVETAIGRALRYAEAGADGVFVPGVAAAEEIRAIAAALGKVPLNVMAVPGLPGAVELRTLGVRRLSAGIGLAAAAYGRARHLARQFLADGRSEVFAEGGVDYREMNALFSRS